MPALLTRMSMPPRRASMSATPFRTASRSVTSNVACAVFEPPPASMFLAASCNAAVSRPLSTTVAPAFASPFAIAKPRPRAAPVTRAMRFERSRVSAIARRIRAGKGLGWSHSRDANAMAERHRVGIALEVRSGARSSGAREMRRAMRVCVLAAASCVSPATLAQLLDFDAACASPPCAAGSAYAVAGVGIAPSALQIVAAGTNGLTGPVGSRFLTVSDPPYQVQITLPRRATSASFWLSRDDSANGNVLVTVTALRNGAVVQTRNRLLTVFGQWVIASIADATGFDQLVCSPDPARRYRASASMRARR